MNTDFSTKVGINGTDKGIVNTNSSDFKALRKAIEESYAQQTLQERLSNRLFALHLKLKELSLVGL